MGMLQKNKDEKEKKHRRKKKEEKKAAVQVSGESLQSVAEDECTEEEICMREDTAEDSDMERTVWIHPVTDPGVTVGLSSIIGDRPYQEDAADVMVNNNGTTLAVVFDGMGGMDDGGQASHLCVRKICEDFNEYQEDDYTEFFAREAARLDRMVFELTDDDGKYIKSGTTFAGVAVTGNKLYWCSVGDSRIYIIRDGEMVQVTRDHNYGLILKEKCEAGLLTEEEIRDYPKKEALISFLGLGKIEKIDINGTPFLLEEEDRILICSDGLYKSMTDEMILRTVELYSDDMSGAAEILTATAACLGNGRQDNTSVIIMKY